MGCKQSTARQRSSSHGDRHRPRGANNSSHRGHSQPHGPQLRAGVYQPQLQLRQQSRTSSQQSSRNSSRFPSQKTSPILPPPALAPPRTETVTGRLGRASLYQHASPLTTTSTSSSSYFCSTNSDEDDYDDEVALLLTPHGGKNSANRSRDSSPSNGDTKTIHVMNNGHGVTKMNRSLTASQRRALKGRLNRSRRRANLHAQARRISEDFAQKSTGDRLHPNGDVSIPFGRAGGSFVLEDVNGGGNEEYYDDGCEAAGGGGFFAGERKFLPYKYKNVHDPSHYCSSTAMVIVAGSQGYKGSGMGSVMKSASSPHIGKSSSSPLGFRRQRRKHIKHSSSQGTLAGSPCGPGSAFVSSSSPLGFRQHHRRTRSNRVKISSTEGSPIIAGHASSASPKFKNSSSTIAPPNNNGSVGSGPINRSGSVTFSSPNHEVSSPGHMIMSRTLGPPETNGYYFGSNISHNTANNHTNNSSQSSPNKNSSKLIMNGSSSVTVVQTLKNNIFYQKCGAGGVHDDDDEYFI